LRENMGFFTVKFLSSPTDDHGTMVAWTLPNGRTPMSPSNLTRRLLQSLRAWRRAPAPVRPDYADYGTAFALDLALGAQPAPAGPGGMAADRKPEAAQGRPLL
jgi:hypothetical protein